MQPFSHQASRSLPKSSRTRWAPLSLRLKPSSAWDWLLVQWWVDWIYCRDCHFLMRLNFLITCFYKRLMFPLIKYWLGLLGWQDLFVVKQSFDIVFISSQVGGALYQIDGYYLPFVVLGSALFTCAILTLLVLPHHATTPDTQENQGSMLKVLKIPGVLVCTFGICATSASIGFISATLEPHLRQFDLSAVKLGVMFIINGGIYALVAPCVGMLVDRCKTPKIASIAGSICVIIGFSLVGKLMSQRPKRLANQTRF